MVSAYNAQPPNAGNAAVQFAHTTEFSYSLMSVYSNCFCLFLKDQCDLNSVWIYIFVKAQIIKTDYWTEIVCHVFILCYNS